MADTIIRVQGLGKRYRIGQQERYLALRDILSRSVTAPLRWGRRLTRPGQASVTRNDHIWALKDVSFEVQRGQAIGIIGANGSGKTTLLKLLSRITEPTEGYGEVHGRVGSLLEVGTSFHPELTGRENVYLNAAILGMPRRDISRRFNDIVAFAEIERFIDTPVKHYSSGMYIRLAFAVAAHLEPDALLIDEVLAVGDAQFQKKCLGRMGDLTSGGNTVVLVSHNMAVIKALTQTTIWLERGQIREIGPSRAVVDKYLASAGGGPRNGVFDSAFLEVSRSPSPSYLHDVTLKSVTLRDSTGRVTGAFVEGSEIYLEMGLECRTVVRLLSFRAPVHTPEGMLVFESLPGVKEVDLSPGHHQATISINLSNLLPGNYHGGIILETRLPQDHVPAAFEFEITPEPRSDDDPYMLMFYPSSDSASTRTDIGIVRVRSKWADTAEKVGEGIW